MSRRPFQPLQERIAQLIVCAYILRQFNAALIQQLRKLARGAHAQAAPPQPLGVTEYLRDGAVLNKTAVLEHEQTLGALCNAVGVVGYHDYRHSLAVELFQ